MYIPRLIGSQLRMLLLAARRKHVRDTKLAPKVAKQSFRGNTADSARVALPFAFNAMCTSSKGKDGLSTELCAANILLFLEWLWVAIQTFPIWGQRAKFHHERRGQVQDCSLETRRVHLVSWNEATEYRFGL